MKKIIKLSFKELTEIVATTCNAILYKRTIYNREKQAKKLIRKLMHPKDENDVIEILHGIKQDIPNTRLLNSNYLPGVVRMIGTEQLDSRNYDDIDDILEAISNDDTLIQKYDSNLNGLYFEELQFELHDKIKLMIAIEHKSLSALHYTTKEAYQIIAIDNFTEAQKYSNYTEWCITKNEFAFASYTAKGQKFYFCLREGFELIQRPPLPSNPKDWYGLSMIAISINSKGRLATSTTRWNEGVPGNKTLSIYEISAIIGKSLFDCI